MPAPASLCSARVSVSFLASAGRPMAVSSAFPCWNSAGRLPVLVSGAKGSGFFDVGMRTDWSGVRAKPKLDGPAPASMLRLACFFSNADVSPVSSKPPVSSIDAFVVEPPLTGSASTRLSLRVSPYSESIWFSLSAPNAFSISARLLRGTCPREIRAMVSASMPAASPPLSSSSACMWAGARPTSLSCRDVCSPWLAW